MTVERHLFTGPECSGKTTAAQWLATALGYALVQEYARAYLTDHRYTYVDVTYIAGRQRMLLAQGMEPGVIYDTGSLVTHIWMLERFGRSSLTDAMVQRDMNRMDYIWLCRPDMTWEDDGMRDAPKDRDRLFDIYVHWLELNDVPYMVLEGPLEQRCEKMMSEAGW